jgi:NAD-reducing hydrogenase large subunit
MLNWAVGTQSHTLSFFHLSGPDLLLGMESEPADRNVMGLVKKYPDIARKGIRIRQIGQEIIRILAGGKSVHPAWSVPGGVREPLTEAKRVEIQAMLPEAFEIIDLALNLLKDSFDKYEPEIKSYGNFPSLYMGLVTPEGGLEHYDGLLRVIDQNGKVLEPGLEPKRYREIIGEAVLPWSYLSSPNKPYGFENQAGMYRVGPPARLNVRFRWRPKADRELRQFRRLGVQGQPVTSSFHYHYARLIEALFSLEKIEETLDDPNITNVSIRSQAMVNHLHGVGVTEAPRGTLFHEYYVKEDGVLQQVNLIVATGRATYYRQNGQTNCPGVCECRNLSEGILNRIEHGIRAYDPCLSCLPMLSARCRCILPVN